MTKRLSIDALQAGMVIVKITEQNGPVKIRKSGLVTSPEMVTGLSEMGVLEVEIDPAQTVEVESPAAATVTQSQTQKLLQSDKQNVNQIDSSMSDQFNRSLFLPSVRSLPPLWMVYLKQSAQYLGVILVGLIIGWSSANYEQWLPNISVAEITANIEPQPNQPVKVEEVDKSPSELIANSTKTEVSVPSQAIANEQTDIAKQEPIFVSSEPNNPIIDINKGERILGYVDPDSDLAKRQQQQDGGIEASQPAISTELQRKLEQAIIEVDNNSSGEFVTPEPTARENVQRIDEIPIYLQNRLPSMAFSAHMYTSEAQGRWVRVNGQRLMENDYIDNVVKIVAIDPEHVILHMEGQTFSMNALTDW